MRAKVIESREDHVKRFTTRFKISKVNVLSRIRTILFAQDFEYSEFQNGVVMLLWGIWMLIFVNHDPAFSQAITILGDEAQEGLWATVFVAIGAYKLYGVLWEIRFARRAASMLAFVYWFYIFLTLVTTSPYLFAVPITLMFALSAVWGHIRLAALRDR